jgi:magnesium transporter
MDYGPGRLDEKDLCDPSECHPFRDTESVTWININGIHDVSIIESIGRHFEIHSLVLEDVMHTGQRPKYEEYDKHVYLVIKMLYLDSKSGEIRSEQVSVILGPRYVISFQEREGDVFDPLRERIRAGKGRIRKAGPDFLAYCLMDAIIDHYFILMESLGEKIETIEENLLVHPSPEMLKRIHAIKNDLIFLRKSVWPLREVLKGLERGDLDRIDAATLPYLRDLYDHTVQVVETVESFRDMVSGIMDIYLSSISNRMNEIMKVLTLFAAVFIPLTFVAGIYGMNFKYMPELEWRFGYAYALVLMAVLGGLLLLFFRKKKWF